MSPVLDYQYSRFIKHTYTVGYDTWVSEAEDYVEFYQINVTKSNAYFYIKKAGPKYIRIVLGIIVLSLVFSFVGLV